MSRFETKTDYKIGDKVWVKPVDAGDLKGEVVRFQVVGDKLPIVEFEYCGEIKSSAFDFARISPLEEGPVKPVYIRII